MANHRIPIGGHGQISCHHLQRREVWRARCRVRGQDNVVRTVEASGRSSAEAKRNLMKVLASWEETARGRDELKPTHTLADLMEFWLAQEAADPDGPLTNTLAGYRRNLAPLMKTVGAYQLDSITPGLLDRHLRALGSADQRRKSRSHLDRMFNVALVQGAVRTNPVTPVKKFRTAPKPVVDIPLSEIGTVRQAAHDWCHADRPGPRNHDMIDLVDFLLGTGCRIGEALAVRWQDLDLEAERPTVRICGTITYESGKGNLRVERTKTSAGDRILYLPAFVADMLRQRHENRPPNSLDAVFATRNGTWHSVSNMGTRWRKIRKGAAIDHISFHAFRRTYATQIDEVLGSVAAGNALGHNDAGRTAEAHYINRAKKPVNDDAVRVIERVFDPSNLKPPTPDLR